MGSDACPLCTPLPVDGGPWLCCRALVVPRNAQRTGKCQLKGDCTVAALQPEGSAALRRDERELQPGRVSPQACHGCD